MDSFLNLSQGQKYKVIKPFIDFDKIVHPMGETWIFITTNFLPYDDGLTLHVQAENSLDEIVYRLQWREEEQAEIIENFRDYVEAC